jgi:hypothetical protein
MAVKTLTDLLKEKNSKLNNDQDPDWVIFINDHLDVIKENAKVVELSNADRDRYLNKFDHFLRDNYCNLNVVWIAKLINEVTMYENFVLKNFILIPNVQHITNLYRIYRTSRNLK